MIGQCWKNAIEILEKEIEKENKSINKLEKIYAKKGNIEIDDMDITLLIESGKYRIFILENKIKECKFKYEACTGNNSKRIEPRSSEMLLNDW